MLLPIMLPRQPFLLAFLLAFDAGLRNFIEFFKLVSQPIHRIEGNGPLAPLRSVLLSLDHSLSSLLDPFCALFHAPSGDFFHGWKNDV